MSQSYDLNRFITAQESIYKTVIEELKAGYKYSHWMWYIFPQFDGLGYSKRAEFYAIKSTAEAKAYLAHPLLGERLLECVQLLLDIENRSIGRILGYPDDLKLKSSMTLFGRVSDNRVFRDILEKYFDGEEDERSLKLMKGL
ncbi:MAG: DUF1810 domain-containing protein [Epsilonproteobacteria bacterium]|nr:DUF1810 domain-containing protein [Campylobacterota bacterium]